MSAGGLSMGAEWESGGHRQSWEEPFFLFSVLRQYGSLLAKGGHNDLLI